jgi:hypothetical protein
MSGKLSRGREDEDSEVGDRDRHRRNAQNDRGRSRSPTPSKKHRKTEENVKKELINEISIDSNENFNRKEKIIGSKELDNLYASYLPSSDYYERSYMHRDILTHLIVTTTDFLITASQDGHIKFWKILTPDYIKQQQQTAANYAPNKTNDEKDSNTNSLINGPIEFVKHFRAHLGLFISFLDKNIFFFFEKVQ